MKIKSDYKRCPRCKFKTFKQMSNCGNCGLNFDKFAMATNKEGIDAVRKGEKERVVWTNKLPSDVNKWSLFFLTLFLGWTGAHLWKVGKFARAISHSIGLVLCGLYIILMQFEMNNFTYNLSNIAGTFWLVTFALAIIDIFEIAFNWFKVPVSLPYKEN